ncbi:MAG: DNA helicase RecG, partial [bacterium]|nr:DNA helicase RecG [bacterium]
MSSKTLKLESVVSQLSGVGPTLMKGLTKLGIGSVRDLLENYPRRWEDYSKTVKIANLTPGLVTIKAKVEKILFKRTFRKRLTIVEAILSDESGTTKAVWFNQPYIVGTLKEGENYFFAGKFEFKNNNLSLQSPTFEESLGLAKSGKIIPIYNENSLINSRLISKLVNQVIDLANHMSDDLPNVISQKNRLMNLD